jgi:hypothetical protein
MRVDIVFCRRILSTGRVSEVGQAVPTYRLIGSPRDRSVLMDGVCVESWWRRAADQHPTLKSKMTYPVSLGVDFQVTQVVSGTGVFDGTFQGKAFVQIGSGSSGIFVIAKNYGSLQNSITVQLLDTGPGTTTALSVSQVGEAIVVTLGRNPGGITSTAAQVAAAINAFSMNPPGFAQPVRSTLTGSGTGIVSAVGATALAGGLDPVVDPSGRLFEWDWTVNTHGGLFYFENDDTIFIRNLQALFPSMSGTNHIQFRLINLDEGLSPISGTDIPFFETDLSPGAQTDSIGVTDVRIPVLPFQAVKVLFTTGTGGPGTVRFTLARSVFP